VVKVAEVEGMEGDTIVLQDIFYFDYSMGVDETGKHLGHLKSTGLRPKFTRRLEDMGIALPANLFEYQAPARR
jgi:pilus assembly protein CpaF